MYEKRNSFYSFLSIIVIPLILMGCQNFSKESREDKVTAENVSNNRAAGDMSGTWKGTIYISKIDVYDDMTITLRKDGNSYSGTVTDSLGTVYEASIQNVKIQADEFRFDTVIYFQGFHRIHNVAKCTGRKMVIKWMIEEEKLGGEVDFKRMDDRY